MSQKRKIVTTFMLLYLMSTPLHAQPKQETVNDLLTQAATCKNQGDNDQAISFYERIIEQDPKHFDAHFLLGNLYYTQGRAHEAIIVYKKSIDLRPDLVQNRFNLAVTYDSINYTVDAILTLEAALVIAPHYTRAQILLASIYLKKGDLNHAAALYNRVLADAPNNIDCLHKLANIYKDTHQHADAITHYKKILSLEPHHQRALLDLAYTHHLAGNIEEAIDTYTTTLHTFPDCLEALCNLAHMQRYSGDINNARNNYQLALAAFPDNLNLQYGYAETLLCSGDFAQGWKYFESRWKRDNDARHFGVNLWDGVTGLHGKIVLLRAEYGHGDTIQFIRFARNLKAAGATVMAEVQGALVKLLANCPFLDKVVGVGEQLPLCDLQIPIMSLPYKLNLSSEQQFASASYIQPDPTLVQQWKSTLARDGNFKIGICWEGSTYYDSLRGPRSKKALHLQTLKALSEIPNVTLYSLQISDARKQIKEVDFEVRDFGPDFDVQHGGYMDTAAVIKSLDLVITVDTSVAHLAGAMNVPVWVVLPSVADWRWMRDRTDTPWYSAMKLFRQTTYGEWESVFNTIKNELAQLLHQRRKASDIVTAEISIGELIDKITILQLKTKYISDKEKLKNIMTELNALNATRNACVPACPELDALTQQLYEVNQRLWDIEDICRTKERTKKFDEEFIKVTRSVYVNNDERCAIKRKINTLMGSRLVEEKSYAAY